jgi:mannose-6-phosphate isomerase-like protein (cupin superfamily)
MQDRTMPLRVLLVTSLLLATGLGLIGLADSLRPLDVSDAPGASADTVATARAFFSAVNAVLATGDATLLGDWVTPDVLEHPLRPGATGRRGLAHALLARRAVFPGLQVVLDEARTADGDLVVVRVHTTGPTTGVFLGLPVSATAAAWGPVDLLRIVNRRVVERWGGAAESMVLDPLSEASLPAALTNAPHEIAVRRVTWDLGTTLAVIENPAAWFLFVERGTLSVAEQPGPPVPTGSGRHAELGPGDTFVVPPGARFNASNEGRLPVTILAVAVWTPLTVSPTIAPSGVSVYEAQLTGLGLGSDATGKIVLAPGVVAHVLTTVSSVLIPTGATLALGRVVLAPGAGLSLLSDGPLLFAVEVGDVEFGVERQITKTTGLVGAMQEMSGHPEIAAGERTLSTIGTAGMWSIDAVPAVVLVVAFLPVST